MSVFFPLVLLTVLKRTKKSKNDLINAEEGDDHFTDISSVGENDTRDTILAILLQKSILNFHTERSMMYCVPLLCQNNIHLIISLNRLATLKIFKVNY